MKKDKIDKIGFGGGCHWCTEAVFQQVPGVIHVEQGWIASIEPHDSKSEAVIVHYNEKVTLEKLIDIHLATHSATKEHSMRSKYRSAVYYFNDESKVRIVRALEGKDDIITQALPFRSFEKNQEKYLDYYRKNPEKAFCKRYIEPKLEKVRESLSVD